MVPIPKSNSYLPSWVSDFKAIKESCSQTKADNIFSASGDSTLDWIQLPPWPALSPRFSISGTTVDTIRGVGNLWKPGSTESDLEQYLGDMWKPDSTDSLDTTSIINTMLNSYLESISVFAGFAKENYMGKVEIRRSSGRKLSGESHAVTSSG